MNKNIARLASFVMAMILTITLYTPGQAATQTALMPARTINIAHFFKPPPNMAPGTAVSKFGAIILTNGDHVYRQKLEDSGFTSSIPEYFRADAIQNPGSCTANPSNNQVAYKVGDFCNISRDHPDWFLLDQYGRRIRVTSGSSYFRMDPGNAGWRNFFLTRVVENQQEYGWSALFLDNVEGGLGRFSGPKPARYPDNASYQAAVSGFLSYLDVNYSQRYGRPIMGNLVASADNAIWDTYLQSLDGAMKERFAVAWSESSYLSASKWLEDLEQVERAQDNGKYLILISPGYRDNARRQKFAFASYLLISNGKAAFRYSTDDAYRQVWWYSNYNVNLGSPVGNRYLQGTVWRRDFTNGYVTVDPVRRVGVIRVTTTSTPTPTQTRTPVPTQTAVMAPTESSGTGSTHIVYNDTHSAFSYSGSWANVLNSQSLGGSFKRTQEVGSAVTLPFTGTGFSVIYKTGPLFGNLDVYVDSQLVGTINQKTDTQQFQRTWSYNTLADGQHELKLVFTGPADTKGSLDAVTIP